MKIGLAIYNFDPRKGGAERYACDLSARLVRRGHAVYVFCAGGVEVQGVTLVKVNTTPFPRWLRNLSFALNHKRLLRTIPLDVMLGFGNTLELDIYQSHGGVQNVWMEREIASYDDPGERKRKAFLLRNSINQRVQQFISEYPIKRKTYSRIVAISEMVRNHMSEYYGIKQGSIDTVYNGVDTGRFRPARAKPEGPLKILFSAGNFRLKGLLPLLLAAGELRKEGKDFQVRIMGRGRKDRYQKIIERLNLTGCVAFLGEQSSPEAVYQESHILAHPTFYDACSLTTMEGMACGLPAITTKWNGASALISSNEGYVIDEPGDIHGLTKAIRDLFNEEYRDRLGKNARIKIEGYTMERNGEEMEKILSSVSRQRP